MVLTLVVSYFCVSLFKNNACVRIARSRSSAIAYFYTNSKLFSQCSPPLLKVLAAESENNAHNRFTEEQRE